MLRVITSQHAETILALVADRERLERELATNRDELHTWKQRNYAQDDRVCAIAGVDRNKVSAENALERIAHNVARLKRENAALHGEAYLLRNVAIAADTVKPVLLAMQRSVSVERVVSHLNDGHKAIGDLRDALNSLVAWKAADHGA